MSADGQAFAAAFQLWSEEANRVRGCLSAVSNRSRLFGPDLARLERMFTRMDLLEGEGLRLVERGFYEEASARLSALIVELRVLTLQLNYLIFASRAEDAGVVSTQWMDAIANLDRRTGPVLDALWSYDRRHIEAVYLGHQSDLRELDEELPNLYARMNRGLEKSRTAIIVADGVTLAISVAQLGSAAGSLGRGGTLTFQYPMLVGVGAGGAATAGTFVISADVLDAIRRLIQIGAISGAVVSAGLGPTVAEPVVVSGTLYMAPTPSGVIVPERGPYKGQRVSYGDPRNKHTRFGNMTLAELKDALKRPRGDLARFVEAMKTKSTDFGSQLTKEGVSRYRELIRKALESGVERGGGLYFEDSQEIGLDIYTREPTRWYQLVGAPSGAHVFPVSSP